MIVILNLLASLLKLVEKEVLILEAIINKHVGGSAGYYHDQDYSFKVW